MHARPGDSLSTSEGTCGAEPRSGLDASRREQAYSGCIGELVERAVAVAILLTQTNGVHGYSCEATMLLVWDRLTTWRKYQPTVTSNEPTVEIWQRKDRPCTLAVLDCVSSMNPSALRKKRAIGKWATTKQLTLSMTACAQGTTTQACTASCCASIRATSAHLYTKACAKLMVGPGVRLVWLQRTNR